MAFVHECSCECTKSELDLFSLPPTQTSLEAASYGEYHPLTSLADGSTIEFEISGTGEDYLDLNNTLLRIKAVVTTVNGTNLPDDANVAPVNYFMHSMFSQLDIFLNGTQITSSTDTYAYRAYLEALLSYGGEAKECQLAAALYYKDDAGKMDSTDADDPNSGFETRKLMARRSNVIDMIGRLHADIFFQDRYVLNETNVKIRLTRNKHAFCLMSPDRFAVKILGAELYVRKIKLSPSISLAHAKALEIGTAKYPIRRVVCKTFTISAGLRDVSHEKLYSGQLPCRLVIGLVDNAGFNGAFERNPFNFDNFSLSEIGLYLDGQQGYNIRPLKLDYGNDQYIDAYMNLFTGSNKVNREEGNCIKRTDFPNGCALYVYDLTPDLAEGDHFNLLKQGTVRLTLRFAAALVRAVTVVTYAEFENVIEIDRSRNILFDFSS
jgi:hypothetical protein